MRIITNSFGWRNKQQAQERREKRPLFMKGQRFRVDLRKDNETPRAALGYFRRYPLLGCVGVLLPDKGKSG